MRTIMMMGGISILVLSGTIVDSFASGTQINAHTTVKSAMYLAKLTYSTKSFCFCVRVPHVPHLRRVP